MYSSMAGCCCATSVGTSSAMAVAHRLERARTNKAFISVLPFRGRVGSRNLFGVACGTGLPGF